MEAEQELDFTKESPETMEEGLTAQSLDPADEINFLLTPAEQ